MAGTESLLLGLFEFVGIEPDPPAFIEYLIDLTSASGPLQIVNDHVPLVTQITLPSLGLC